MSSLTFALANGEDDEDVLTRPQRPTKEPILSDRAVAHRCIRWGHDFAKHVACAGGVHPGWLGFTAEQATTASFITSGLAQLWNVFNIRTPWERLLQSAVTENRLIW